MDRTGDLPVARPTASSAVSTATATSSRPATTPTTVEFGGLIKHDMTTGDDEVWDTGPAAHSGRVAVRPRRTRGEDAGYLLTYVHDEATDKSELVVIDATEVADGPIAQVELPARVPYGFHAAWVPA